MTLDTIFNHMSGADSGTGVAGSSFTHYNYPGIYQVQDFHHCGLEPNDNIVNYDNAVEVQTCQLDGLAECDFSSYVTCMPIKLTMCNLPAWRRRQNTSGADSLSTQMICFRWAWTASGWMLPNVGLFIFQCYDPSRLTTLVRYRRDRSCQYHLPIEPRSLYHSGGNLRSRRAYHTQSICCHWRCTRVRSFTSESQITLANALGYPDSDTLQR